MPEALTLGRIIWAEVADENGIFKLRPAVIVSLTSAIESGKGIDIVAITSRLPSILPDDHVLLPWHANGHPRTRLNRKCAAVVSWVARIVEREVRDIGGIVPSSEMAVILAKIAARATPPTSRLVP